METRYKKLRDTKDRGEKKAQEEVDRTMSEIKDQRAILDALKAQIADATHANASLCDDLVKCRQGLKAKEHDAEQLTAETNAKSEQIQNEKTRLQQLLSEQKSVTNQLAEIRSDLTRMFDVSKSKNQEADK